MKRVMVYLNENIWRALRIRSNRLGTSISELVRQAIHEKYGGSRVARAKAMQAAVGLWKDRNDLPDTDSYVRRLREGKRLARILSPGHSPTRSNNQ
jgi:hypothetical protein